VAYFLGHHVYVLITLSILPMFIMENG